MNRGEPPTRIFVYRDGVGDGQLGYVARHEASQLEDCFKHFSHNYAPQLVFVVVQKRINQRIFAQIVSSTELVFFMPPPPLGPGGIRYFRLSVPPCGIPSVQNLVNMISSECMSGFLLNLVKG